MAGGRLCRPSDGAGAGLCPSAAGLRGLEPPSWTSHVSFITVPWPPRLSPTCVPGLVRRGARRGCQHKVGDLCSTGDRRAPASTARCRVSTPLRPSGRALRAAEELGERGPPDARTATGCRLRDRPGAQDRPRRGRTDAAVAVRALTQGELPGSGCVRGAQGPRSADLRAAVCVREPGLTGVARGDGLSFPQGLGLRCAGHPVRVQGEATQRARALPPPAQHVPLSHRRTARAAPCPVLRVRRPRPLRGHHRVGLPGDQDPWGRPAPRGKVSARTGVKDACVPGVPWCRAVLDGSLQRTAGPDVLAEARRHTHVSVPWSLSPPRGLVGALRSGGIPEQPPPHALPAAARSCPGALLAGRFENSEEQRDVSLVPSPHRHRLSAKNAQVSIFS